MLLLFSSDFSPRYKQNVLDYLCYPQGHTVKVRYQNKHVSPRLRTRDFSKSGKTTALLCYAETPTGDANDKFRFCPIREARITKVQIEGTVHYVYARLGACVNYGSTTQNRTEMLQRFQDEIEAVSRHPLPPGSSKAWSSENEKGPKSDSAVLGGYFFLDTEDKNIVYDTAEDHPHQAWESVIEVLGKFDSHKRSIFFKVLGFYWTRRKWFGLKSVEENIQLKAKNDDTRIPLPMGEIVTLKLLFYRSEEADKSVLPLSLTVNLDKEAFSGVSQSAITVSSRYNEETIRLVCKRVFDSVLAPISITYDNNDGSVVAPRPFLHTYVNVRKTIVGLIVTALVLAPFLLTSTPELFKWLGGLSTELSWLHSHPDLAAFTAKGLGALIAGVAGFFAFRKLPV